MAIKIKNYIPYPQEQIDATIFKLETEMFQYLLKAAKWNTAGDGSTKWLKKADVNSLQIHTLVTKCDEKTYEFVDESLIEGSYCSVGGGIGNWKIAGAANSLNCDLFVVSSSSQIPPPNGTFRYCTFKTTTFKETVGIMPPCTPIVCQQLPYTIPFNLQTCD